jgi:hypothetical protein
VECGRRKGERIKTEKIRRVEGKRVRKMKAGKEKHRA